MIELEEGFSKNDEYLIREYEKHGTEDFLMVEFGEKSFVVPYKYTIGSNTVKTSQGRFLSALLDFQAREARKYREAGEVVMSVAYQGQEYIIPYGTKGMVSPEVLAKEVQETAEVKYNSIINSLRELEAAGEKVDVAEFSGYAGEKYAARLAAMGKTALLDKETPERLKVLGFLKGIGTEKLTKFQGTAQGLVKSLSRKIIEAERDAARKYVPVSYKTAALAALISGGTAGTYFAFKAEEKAQPKEEWSVASLDETKDDAVFKGTFDASNTLPENDVKEVTKETAKGEKAISFAKNREHILRKAEKQCEASEKLLKSADEANGKDKGVVYVDFMGRKYHDVYGNVRRLLGLKAEITALLLSVEGYAGTAFNDGGGTPTFGMGTTQKIDKKGRETPVKFGERLSKSDAVLYKWRYVEKYMMPLIAQNVKRKCSNEECLALIGAGFCWGPGGLERSKFFKSVCKGDNMLTKQTAITEKRSFLGHLKRGYLLAQVMSGTWTAKELLDMPVFKDPKRGYVNCGIYTQELHQYLPCKKDKKGNYVKDDKGCDKPLTRANGLCFPFYSKMAQENLEAIRAHTTRNKDYKRVRDLMPEEMLLELTQKYGKTKQLTAADFKVAAVLKTVNGNSR